jgi:uracil-DNA glycosylase family 4
MDISERQSLIRAVRQRRQSLADAGLDRIALPGASTPKPRAAVRAVASDIQPQLRAPEPIVARPLPKPTPSPSLGGSLFEEPGLSSPILSSSERDEALVTLAAEVSVCTRCPHLAATRTQTVFGVGSPTARLMFVGEAPGADEDRLGEPFIGKAGTLLTDMITKGMGLRREDVYIANVLKSRPPDNRTPVAEEVSHCLPFLERQIAIVRPEFLCLLGKTAITALLETSLPMNRLRGKWHRYRGIPTIVTWHPSYLLRTPSAKKDTWEDLQLLMQAMGLKPPERKRATKSDE